MRESAVNQEQTAQWQAPPASEARLRLVPDNSATPESGLHERVGTGTPDELKQLEDERALLEEETSEIKLQLADAEQRGNSLLMKLMTEQGKAAADRLQAIRLRLKELESK